jgi:hypothetical protein
MNITNWIINYLQEYRKLTQAMKFSSFIRDPVYINVLHTKSRIIIGISRNEGSADKIRLNTTLFQSSEEAVSFLNSIKVFRYYMLPRNQLNKEPTELAKIHCELEFSRIT